VEEMCKALGDAARASPRPAAIRAEKARALACPLRLAAGYAPHS
jgi:hypothetical protein